MAEGMLNTIKKNKEQVSQECYDYTEKQICSRYFPPCYSLGEVEIPQLTCQSACEDYWSACQVAFDLYYDLTVKLLKAENKEDTNVQHCGSGTWTNDNQPSDRFGVRYIPFSPTWIEGYRNQLLYPDGNANYTMPNGSIYSIPCVPAMPAVDGPLQTSETCDFPLQPATIDGQEGVCAIPCPFPVIDQKDLRAIGWAFVAPALLGVLFSVFVCVDTLWHAFDLYEGGTCYKRLRRHYGKGMLESRQETGSSTGDKDVLSNNNENTTSSSTGRRRVKMRSSMAYALIGSLLGIVYFVIGPLMTLLKSENVSCSDGAFFSLAKLRTGQIDFGDGLCKAQRVAPFVLQAIFNLMLFALFQVLIMVDQRFKQWTARQLNILHTAMTAYCGLGPLVTMGIALGVDESAGELENVFNRLGRNAAICTMRLTVAQEIILVLLPFILTGLCVSALSFYIWLRLSNIQAGVKNLIKNTNKASDRSLRLLMMRLSVLGLTTFCVIIVLVATTAYLMDRLGKFSPLFNQWFACNSVSLNCQNPIDCPALKEAAFAVAPTSAAFAVQIAAMSCISLLLSGFFAAQSGPRLFAEWKDGSLSQKLDNVLEGRPLHYNVVPANTVGAINPMATSADTLKGKIQTATIAESSARVHDDKSVMPAAYMSEATTSPVFDHEMIRTASTKKSDDE